MEAIRWRLWAERIDPGPIPDAAPASLSPAQRVAFARARLAAVGVRDLMYPKD